MQNDPSERYQKASEVKTELSSIPLHSGRAASPKQPSPATPPSGALGQSALPKSRTPLLLGLVGATAVIAVGAFFALRRGDDGRAAAPSASAKGNAQTTVAKAAATPNAPRPVASSPAKTATPAPFAAPALPESGWKPLVSPSEWQKYSKGTTDYQGQQVTNLREYKDGLLHMSNISLYGTQPFLDGAIRARLVMRVGSEGGGVGARNSGKQRYFFNLADKGTVMVLAVRTPDSQAGKTLGSYRMPKPLQPDEKFTIELRIQGDQLTGLFNGQEVVRATDQRVKEVGTWGIDSSDAWFESAEVQPLPAAALASTAQPTWQKLRFTAAEVSSQKAQLEADGSVSIDGAFNLPGIQARNIAVRAEMRKAEGKFFPAKLRWSKEGSRQMEFFANDARLQIQLPAQNQMPTLALLQFPKQLIQPGEWVPVEFAVIGERSFGKVRGAPFPAGTSTQVLQAGGVAFTGAGSVRNIEVLNLDGLPEAEALRLLGVDEKGNDLRGKEPSGVHVSADGWIDLLAQMHPSQDAWKPGGHVGANQWQRKGTSLTYIADEKIGKITAPGLLASGTFEMTLGFSRDAEDVNVRLDLIGASSAGGKTGGFALEFAKTEVRAMGATLIRSDKPWGAGGAPILVALSYAETNGFRTMKVSVNGAESVTVPLGKAEPLSGTPALSVMAGRSGAVFHEWRLKPGTALWTANRDLAFKGPSLPLDPVSSSTAKTATKDTPFINTLGMKFVPVPGTKVLFSIWHTRVQDYAEFAKAQEAAGKKVDGSWKTQAKDGVPVGREPDHPVVGVSWEDAQAFCQWLTAKETAEGKLPQGMKYRLPTDAEWSTAVGLPPEMGSTPKEKNGKNGVDFPWGKDYPPTKKVGNFADESFHARFPTKVNEMDGKKENEQWLKDYMDGYATTSPVGAFPANAYGLYDMGGNVWQWCEDWASDSHQGHVLRGGCWTNAERRNLASSARSSDVPSTRRYHSHGFRCMLEPAPSTAVVSPSPNLPVPARNASRSDAGGSKSYDPKFPPGQWVKLFTKPEDLPADLRKPDSGVKWEDGWLRFGYQFRVLKLPLGSVRNLGVRVTSRRQGAKENITNINLRNNSDGTSRYQLDIKSGGTIFGAQKREQNDYPLLWAIPLPKPNKVGDTCRMEFAAVENRLVGRFDDTVFKSVIDNSIAEGFVSISSDEDLRDIEVLNLDGLPEAEALRLLGVDEQGKDLRGKTGASPSPSLPVSSSPSSATKAAPLEPGAIRLWDAPEKLTSTPKGISWKDDALLIHSSVMAVRVDNKPLTHRDSIVRFSLRMNRDAQWANVIVRDTGTPAAPRQYKLSIHPPTGVIKFIVADGGMERVLLSKALPRPYAPEEWLRVELRSVGGDFTVSLDGQPLETVHDTTLPNRGLTHFGATANAYFRDIVYVPLDQSAGK
jgi:formylglycine-generating enzyme required for sulfatase activity